MLSNKLLLCFYLITKLFSFLKKQWLFTFEENTFLLLVISNEIFSGNSIVPQNQQFYIKSKVHNDQPVFVQVAPNSNVAVSNSKVAVSNLNVVVPNDNDVFPNENAAAQSDNVEATSENTKISSSSVTVIKNSARTLTSKENEAFESEESTKKTFAKTDDS